MLSSKNDLSHSFATFLLALVLVITTVGCPATDSSESAKTPKPSKQKSAVSLKIAVEEDADLVRAIERLRGEWGEHSSGELIIIPFAKGDDSESIAKASLDADLIVFASAIWVHFAKRS